MSFLSAEDLLKIQSHRYATKSFDANRSIPDATWEALVDCLLLTPSSYNIQPWKFVVVKDEATKETLRGHSFRQSQVEDCSHLVVLCSMKTMDRSWIDRLIRATALVKNVTEESLQGYAEMMNSDLLVDRKNIMSEVSIRHCFLAMGNLMTSAAVLGLDTCPIEGFKPDLYDEVLGLKETNWKSALVCAVGYRDSRAVTPPRVRFSKDEVFKTI